MATWSQIESNIANVTLMSSIVSDKDDNIYFASSSTSVEVYNVTADTVTTIGNGSSWGGGTIPTSLHLGSENCLAYFKNNLYVIVQGSTNTVEVWQYDGSGTSWTSVLGQDIGDAMSLIYDSDYMVACGYNTTSNNGHTTTSYYTANGSSWSAATIDIEVGYKSSSTGIPAIQGSSHIEHGRGIYAEFWEYATPSNNYKVYKFNGGAGNWDVEKVQQSNPVFFLSSDDLNWGVFGTYKYSTTYSGWSDPTDGNIQPMKAQNMEESVGYRNVSGNVTIYFWGAGDWAESDTAFTLSGGTAGKLMRFNDTSVFLVMRDGSNNWHIYQRSEGYGDPVNGGGGSAGNRLWLYKSTDNGLVWTSRGIKT